MFKVIKSRTYNGRAQGYDIANIIADTDPHTEFVPSTPYQVDTEVKVVADKKWYKALQATSGAEVPDPLADTPYWKIMGAINEYKFDDESLNTQTEGTGLVEIDIVIPASTTIALLGLYGTDVYIEVKDSAGNPLDPSIQSVFEEKLIIKDSQNATEHYFNEVLYNNKVSVTIPGVFHNAQVKIKVSQSIATDIAKIGFIHVGIAREVGPLLWGVETGIIDFSIVKRDEFFGTIEIIEGDFVDEMEGEIIIDTPLEHAIGLFLASIRAKKALFIGSEQYKGTIIFGILKEWRKRLSDGVKSEIKFRVEGVV